MHLLIVISFAEKMVMLL